MEVSTTSRASFDDENSSRNRGDSRCTKYRKITNEDASKQKKGGVLVRSANAAALNDLSLFQHSLFGCSDFLPLDHAKKAAAMYEQRVLFSAAADTNKLTDDALGLCFFSGFLDTFEVLRLTKVSKRIRDIAFKQVTMLDLRNCEQITPTDIASIASSFQNLTVSYMISLSRRYTVHNVALILTIDTICKLICHRILTFHTVRNLLKHILNNYYQFPKP